MGQIYTGIGGWNFDPWRGPVYPPEVKKKDELAYAASKLTAIEINSTYYGSQKPATFANWAAAAPDGFKFAAKASRFCTNRRVLAEAGESVERFCNQGITELGEKLGPILWQFAPTKQFDASDMGAFVALLPDKVAGVPLRHALEVRHESFRDPAFTALMKKANAAIVYADHPEYPCIDEETADFAYARLMKTEEDVETGYPARALDDWATEAKRWAKRGDAYAFFISGAKVRNPAAAMALIERLPT